MDIDGASFFAVLPTLLKHIGESDFVAFDLELSGIPVRSHGKGRSKQQTVQERYAELKQAAEKFHILQFGFTLVRRDPQHEKYILRSYNFNISPLVDDMLEMDREFTFSASAVNFLWNNGYDMNSPLLNGIPYLTRTETLKAKEHLRAKQDRDAIPDIVLDPEDDRAHAFMARVRKEIKQWQKSHKPDPDFYNVAGKQETYSRFPEPLTGFQRRLVHQLIRSEFPGLQTTSRRDFVAVEPKDEEQQARTKARVQKEIDMTVFKHVGFRWVTEALSGDNSPPVEHFPVIPSIQDEPETASPSIFHDRFEKITRALRTHSRVLVGHNCLIDFVYMWHTFYGELPETVEEFSSRIRETFPLVFDTKFIATEGDSDVFSRRLQLGQIAEMLEDQEFPLMEIRQGEWKAEEDTQTLHEAGYDSLVTAQVFLKLAARLQINVDVVTAPPPPVKESNVTTDQSVTAQTAPKEGNKRKKKAKSKTRQKQPTNKDSKFSSTNTYGGLGDEFDEVYDPSEEELPTQSAENPISSASTMDVEGVQMALASVATNRMLPDFRSSRFWDQYANKLRVYGTQEQVLDLQGPGAPKAAASDEEPEQRGLERRMSLLDRIKGLVIG